MTTIWQNEGDAWRLLSPVGFPAEVALHDIVAQAPALLPLSGSPRLAVLGREVPLGTGYADILAVEDSGRLVVIEVKLSRNSEARRAVVAQVLSYAAHVHRMTLDGLKSLISSRGNIGMFDELVSPILNENMTDTSEFESNVRASLSNGWFRIVLVLDEAPDDLVRLVGYLEHVTDEQLIVDLVTVSSYDVNGARVVVPRRIDSRVREFGGPEETRGAASPERQRSAPAPIVEGSTAFEEFFTEIEPEYVEPISRLTEWARGIESRGLARLRTSIGTGRRVLRVQVPGEDASIVAVWAERRRPGFSVHTSVVARRAPGAMARLGELLPVTPNPYLVATDVTDELLFALTGAYEEAASGRLTTGHA